MDSAYEEKLKVANLLVNKVNPLSVVLADNLNTLIANTDLLLVNTEEKRDIRKYFRQWAKKNHPDKWVSNGINELHQEASYYLYQRFADAILKCDDQEFHQVWVFMGYSALTFSGVEFHNLTLSDACRLIRDIDMLIDIIYDCRELPDEMVEVMVQLKNVLDFFKKYLSAKERNICTKHSTEDNLIGKDDCSRCIVDETPNIVGESSNLLKDVVCVSDDSTDEEDHAICVSNLDDRDVGVFDANGSEDDSDGGSDVENNKPDDRLKKSIRAELQSLDTRTLLAIAKSKELKTGGIVEKSELIDIIADHDINYREMRNIRNHRKRDNPTKYSLPISTWDGCERTLVEELPHDIDGLKVYVMKIDHSDRMGSTKDGRKWCTWVTSSRKGFSGTRRTANCDGCYICRNHTCKFYLTYNKENAFHFRRNKCKICNEDADRILCDCKKIWEFNEESDVVTIYYHGIHNCVPKPYASDSTSKLKEKFSNRNVTPTQASNEIIVDAIENDNIDDIDSVVDSVLDKQKLKNLKKKCMNENRPLGHSFEAVSDLKSKISRKDKFYIYKVNDRKMNDCISYVFKTSEPLLQLALSMDMDKNGTLNQEYAFFDGTFKRCPGYVTLACHVYVEVLNMMVKIFTMETESESADCAEHCWKLFNTALQELTGDRNVIFNPSGWVMDEASGLWNGLRVVFGEAANRSVSCEWHYTQSCKQQSKHLSSSGEVFGRIANNMMLALTEKEYESALNDLEAFIEEKKEKRNFLYDWLSWWDKRRSHFSKAYKNVSAPSTNLSEAYNSKYVTGKEVNLKLVDAAKLDIAEAMKFDRAYKRFADGMPANGTGPASHERLGRDNREQKKRARKYADLIVNEGTSDTAEVESKKRKWRNDSTNSSKDANPGSGKSKRTERRRSTRSQKFNKSLMKAKENHRHIVLLSVNQVSDYCQKCTIKYFNQVIKVEIQEKPSCSCSFYTSNNQKGSETCVHIIWTMMNYYRIREDDSILQQVSLTPEEVDSIFNETPNVDILNENMSDIPSSSTKLTAEEERAIFETKENNQHWRLNKLCERKNAHCATCKSTMPPGKIFVELDALYIPPNQNFAVNRKFYFCACFLCLKKVQSSNIVPPTQDTFFEFTEGSNFSSEDKALLKSRGFKIEN